MKHTLPAQQGFTLLEVMIAMFILGVALLTLITMQVTGIRGNATASRVSTAADWGSSQIETIFGLAYDDAKLTNTAAGLNNAVVANASGSVVSPDGFYTVFWNVADDQPMRDLKTIRVIVNRVDQGQTKAVTMNYIKARYQ